MILDRHSDRNREKALREAVKYTACFNERSWYRGARLYREFGFRSYHDLISATEEYDMDVDDIQERMRKRCRLSR